MNPFPFAVRLAETATSTSTAAEASAPNFQHPDLTIITSGPSSPVSESGHVVPTNQTVLQTNTVNQEATGAHPITTEAKGNTNRTDWETISNAPTEAYSDLDGYVDNDLDQEGNHGSDSGSDSARLMRHLQAIADQHAGTNESRISPNYGMTASDFSFDVGLVTDSEIKMMMREGEAMQMAEVDEDDFSVPDPVTSWDDFDRRVGKKMSGQEAKDGEEEEEGKAVADADADAGAGAAPV